MVRMPAYTHERVHVRQVYPGQDLLAALYHFTVVLPTDAVWGPVIDQ
jgi:hypothetical protein